jgi:hypothetical protein
MVWLAHSPQVLIAQMLLTTFAVHSLPQFALFGRQSRTYSYQQLLKCT